MPPGSGIFFHVFSGVGIGRRRTMERLPHRRDVYIRTLNYLYSSAEKSEQSTTLYMLDRQTLPPQDL